MAPRVLIFLLLAGVLAGAGSGAGAPAPAPVASATAYGITVVVPGQPGAGAAQVSAPNATPASSADGFAYPADGTAVSTGVLSSSVSARADRAQAVTDVLAVSLFNGEITVSSVAARASARGGAGDAGGSGLVDLVLLGQPVAAVPNARFPLADWGFAVTLEQVVDVRAAGGIRQARAVVTGLRVVLSAEHGGLPAGTEILVGHAEAETAVPVAPAPVTPPATSQTTTTTKRPAQPGPRKPKALPRPPEPESSPIRPGPVFRRPPLDISAPLSPSGYVFPVYGPSSFTDTFGAPRAGIGWHHGEDIFAPLGAPLLAVADGTVFSVGWNDRGGYRLWLRDRQGNQFYYAHLSAFSPLAVNGNEVRAGDVIGFLGNTGDAQTTPYHLHFEIHPVGLLPMGYDGVVNAFPYLSAWRRLQDVTFSAGRGWAPPVPASASAPRPGAVLLGSSDISSASGLEPGSLERALAAPVSSESDGALIRAG